MVVSTFTAKQLCKQKCLSYLASLCKDVLSCSHEICCIKAWFKLSCNALALSMQLEAFLHIRKGVVMVVQLIAHLRFRGSCPLGTLFEVLLNEWAIGTVLKVPSSPGHGSFDDLVTNHKQEVPGNQLLHINSL